VVRVELGKKHTCKECGVKFYDLNKEEPACPECDALVVIHNTTKDSDLIISKVSKASGKINESEEENENISSLDENLEEGIIDDDNPIILVDEDILDDESEDGLINDNDIDIPDIENEDLIDDDDNDFLVEDDDVDESDLIIKPKSDDE
jgi:hypothetical protein